MRVISKLPIIIEKIYHKFFIKLHQISHAKRCYYKLHTLDKTKRLVLYLNYPTFIHFGDSLWFEPIARLLKMANYDLVIYSNPEMELYFRRLGYKIIAKKDITMDDILVTRTELAFHLRLQNVFWLYFDYTGLTKPLIDTMLESISTFLYLNWQDITPKPQKIEFTQIEKAVVANKFKLLPTKTYAIFSNYIDSHKFGLNNSDLRRDRISLSNYARKYKSEKDMDLIHTGSSKDKSMDKTRYDIIDIDLRGMTNIFDIFALVSLDNVVDYIGFDTFPMHVFNLYDKTCYIVLRPGFSNEYNVLVKNYVAIPFSLATAKIIFA